MEKKLALKLSDDWYPVLSAFGGCGIYKKSSIKGCWYSATVTDDLESVMKEVILKGFSENHPQVFKYQAMVSELQDIVCLGVCRPGLQKITNDTTGIILGQGGSPVVWKMSSFVYQFPSVCEHVPFHASMITKGKDKIFINPRLVFTYGG